MQWLFIPSPPSGGLDYEASAMGRKCRVPSTNPKKLVRVIFKAIILTVSAVCEFLSLVTWRRSGGSRYKAAARRTCSWSDVRCSRSMCDPASAGRDDGEQQKSGGPRAVQIPPQGGPKRNRLDGSTPEKLLDCFLLSQTGPPGLLSGRIVDKLSLDANCRRPDTADARQPGDASPRAQPQL